MPKHRTELFGQFIYDPEISYDDLLALEEEVTAFISESLTKHGGSFISFEPEGDRTFFQCAFSEYSEKLFKDVCKTLRSKIGTQTECKLLFVDKMMQASYFFGLNHKNTVAERFTHKVAGPIDKALAAQE